MSQRENARARVRGAAPVGIAPRAARALVELAREAGVSGTELLMVKSADEAGQIELADYFRLQRKIALAIADETCRQSARQLLPGTTDFALGQVSRAATLDDVMRILARAYNLLHGGAYNRVARLRNRIDFVMDDRDFPYTDPDDQEAVWTAAECVQMFVHGMFSLIAPGLAERGLLEVSIRRPSGEPAPPHLSFWSVPVRFGASAYRLEYSAAVVCEKIASPDPAKLSAAAVYQRVIDMIGENRGSPNCGLTDATAARVRVAIATGEVEQEGVAERLGVSVATLRRHLAAEATSFRALRREVLDEAAKASLLAGRTVADVAETLGFSDVRSFNRAFKDWNGFTPKTFAGRRAGFVKR